MYFIENKQNTIMNSTSNMDNHISFVENVYETLKNPLNYVANKINHHIGYIAPVSINN
jgi:hypothetical protein